MGVMDVAPMGVAVVPIFKLLEWGRGGLSRARCEIIATAANELYATTLIVSATTARAFCRVRYLRRHCWCNDHRRLVVLVGLGLAVGHDSRPVPGDPGHAVVVGIGVYQGEGVVANGVAKHLNLTLHCIVGGVAVTKALLCGDVSSAKVGDSIGQGGCRCIVLYGVHAVALLQGQTLLPGTGTQQGVQIPVMDAIPRPWWRNWLPKHQQMCGHILQ